MHGNALHTILNLAIEKTHTNLVLNSQRTRFGCSVYIDWVRLNVDCLVAACRAGASRSTETG